MSSTILPIGSYVAVLTPLDQNLSADIVLLIDHCKNILDAGAQGIALLGTTGEGNSFTLSERKEIMSALVEGGIPGNKMMVGTGCPAYGDTIELNKHALHCGIASVLMLPPYYYKQLNDAGLFNWFERVIQETADERLEVYLYHIPKLTGIHFSIPLLERFVTIFPNTIVGMKDSGGDLQHMHKIIEHFPEFKLFAGTENYLLDVLRKGGAGSISATANVTVELCSEVFEKRNEPGVHRLQEKLSAVRACFEGLPFTSALKQYMAKLNHDSRWLNVRPPNSLVEPAKINALFEKISHINDTI